MPKIVNKRTKDRNPNINRLTKSIKSVDPNDESFCNRWTAGDGFKDLCISQNPDKSSSNNSSDSSISSKRSARTGPNNGQQLMSTYRSPEMNPKLLFKKESRFATRLTERNRSIVCNDDDGGDGDNVDDDSQSLPQIESQISLSQNISNMSSPMKQSQAIISPTSSPNRSPNLQIPELSYNQLVIDYFDKIEQMFKYKNQCNNTETSLQIRANKVLKNIKQSRLEFCQIDSFKLDDSKAVTLRLTKTEPKFGLTVVRSLVLNDRNSKYPQNTEILLVLNHTIAKDLKQNSIVKLYPRWTELRLQESIVFFNAFNIQVIEFSQYFQENNEDINEDVNEDINENINEKINEDTDENIPAIIWQNESS